MKSELKAKFLQHLISKKQGTEGFTLIELLVVIIIIGILAAIALPSFLNQANKARQSEAQTYVGSINRGQQAYYLQNNEFADKLSSLELGVPDKTDYYTYAPSGGGKDSTSATIKANVNKGKLRAYTGVTYLGTAGGNSTTLAKICEGQPVGGDGPDCPATS